jgi:2-dehydro-3-deoxyphosphogluconate aldolase/(4S)-4-hydroxy-2-oxoglutarate aldolase
MQKIFEKLSQIKIVPVVTIEDASNAARIAEALCGGGLPCAEITFRTEAAADSIREMTKAFPEMLVGAGTILTARQADAAIEAGAKFLVAPGLNPETVKYCREKNFAFLPGVCTPSEIEQAMSLGLDTLKFFPAEAAGGVAMLKSLCAPYSKIKFMPTGGISPANIREYLAIKNVFACGGSWIVKDDFEETKKIAREALSLI